MRPPPDKGEQCA